MSELYKKLKVQLGNVERILKLKEENTDHKEINKKLWDKLNQLQKENTKLKKQIADIKYLSYQEVECILLGYLEEDGVPEDLAAAICSLAIPITKEKIIEVLKDYLKDICPNLIKDSDFVEQIASAILGNNDKAVMEDERGI